MVRRIVLCGGLVLAMAAAGCSSSRSASHPAVILPSSGSVLPPARISSPVATTATVKRAVEPAAPAPAAGVSAPTPLPSASRLSTGATVTVATQTAEPAKTASVASASSAGRSWYAFWRKAPVRSNVTARASAYLLQPGDQMMITLRGIPNPEEIQESVDEDGTINLPFIGEVKLGGKPVSEAEKVIQQTYIEKQIFKTITVNVLMPSQSYYIRGEVRLPGRYPLGSGMTLVQAVAAAGGYSDYASTRSVEVTRGGRTVTVNARDAKNFPVETGDVIVVPRSLL